MLKVLSRIIDADFDAKDEFGDINPYPRADTKSESYKNLMKFLKERKLEQKLKQEPKQEDSKLDEIEREIANLRSSINYNKEKSASAYDSDQRSVYEKRLKADRKKLEEKLKERDSMKKVTSKLKCLLASNKEDDLNKKLGINNFIKQADSIEKQSDFLTYHQIQRIGNPLSQKMKMEMQKLQKLGDKESVDYLKQLLKTFVDKKWIS